jgi:trigger factor
MKVTQEKLPASQIGLEIEINPETTKKTYEKVIQNLSKTANIPGFRKGKVPRPILLQRLGTLRVKATALEEIIQDGIQEAVKQVEISPIGQPQLRTSFDDLISTYEPGKPLTFSAAVDVEPEVTLAQYSGLTFQAEEVKYDAERVDKALEENRREMATLIPVEGRAAQLGDVAIVDFKGVVLPEGEGEPEPIEGGEASDFQIDLQEDRFIPGFIIGIVGMNPGETKEVSAQFPDPYANEELAGKPAQFTITLKELKEKELPELNDDFAQEASEYKTLAELQGSLEEKFKKEAEDKTKTNKKEALLKALVEQLTVDLPDTMVQQEVDAILMQTATRLSQQGLDVRQLFTKDIIGQLRSRSRGEAIDRIKRSLVLREVATKESIKLTQEEVTPKVQELMEQYKGQDVDPDKLIEAVENEMLTERIFDWLLQHSTVELLPEGSLAKDKVEEIEEIEEIGEVEGEEEG